MCRHGNTTSTTYTQSDTETVYCLWENPSADLGAEAARKKSINRNKGVKSLKFNSPVKHRCFIHEHKKSSEIHLLSFCLPLLWGTVVCSVQALICFIVHQSDVILAVCLDALCVMLLC